MPAVAVEEGRVGKLYSPDKRRPSCFRGVKCEVLCHSPLNYPVGKPLEVKLYFIKHLSFFFLDILLKKSYFPIDLLGWSVWSTIESYFSSTARGVDRHGYRSHSICFDPPIDHASLLESSSHLSQMYILMGKRNTYVHHETPKGTHTKNIYIKVYALEIVC